MSGVNGYEFPLDIEGDHGRTLREIEQDFGRARLSEKFEYQDLVRVTGVIIGEENSPRKFLGLGVVVSLVLSGLAILVSIKPEVIDKTISLW